MSEFLSFFKTKFSIHASVRLKICLLREIESGRINSLEDLYGLDRKSFTNIRNLGDSSFREFKVILNKIAKETREPGRLTCYRCGEKKIKIDIEVIPYHNGCHKLNLCEDCLIKIMKGYYG